MPDPGWSGYKTHAEIILEALPREDETEQDSPVCK
jgi:hypothetical protein